MSEFFESLFHKQIDHNTALLLAFGGMAAMFALFLAIRSLWSAAKPTPGNEESLGLLAELQQRRRQKSFSERFDSAFEGLVKNTGLGLTVQQTLGWIILAGAFGATAFYMARPELILALIGLALGVGLTLLVLANYQSQQRLRIRDQLPEIFYMLARSTRAGMSVEQAIAMLAQEHKLLLAPEFRHCASRIELGMPAVTALEMIARRLNMLDFDGLVALVDLNQSTGGNLPTLLDRLATCTRDHNQFRSYVRSATALGRASALCIGLATPLVLLGYAIIQPEFCLAFFRSTYGWTMVGIALGLDVVGGIWLFFLTRVEY